MIELKKGLDLPIAGAPRQEIEDARPVSRVGVLGSDYPGLRPTMKVAEGDSVQIGTPLFEDKKNPGVVVTSPAAGKIEAIVRGEKRALTAVVIAVEGDREVALKFRPRCGQIKIGFTISPWTSVRR